MPRQSITVEDGRAARRDRNRSAVIDATLALILENGTDPAVEEVSQRSGVSARSIFRYFNSLEDLRRAVIRRNFERVAPLLHLDGVGDGPLEDRIARFVRTRLDIWEHLAAPARAAQSRGGLHPTAVEEIDRFRTLLDTQLQATFAHELGSRRPGDAAEVEALISALVSFDSWNTMSNLKRRSRQQIARAWTRGVAALIRCA